MSIPKMSDISYPHPTRFRAPSPAALARVGLSQRERRYSRNLLAGRTEPLSQSERRYRRNPLVGCTEPLSQRERRYRRNPLAGGTEPLSPWERGRGEGAFVNYSGKAL